MYILLVILPIKCYNDFGKYIERTSLFVKKIFYLVLSCEIILFFLTISIFMRKYSDFTHIAGTYIVLAIYILMIFLCKIVVDVIFRKTNFKTSKNFRRDMKNTFANAFFSSSLVAIILACILYGFSHQVFELLGFPTGIINYCSFITKIWFISSPFIGLEITIFKYFSTLEYFPKPIKLIVSKFLLFICISILFYTSRKINCFIYAKPVSDILFLFYYSKICLDITLNKA